MKRRLGVASALLLARAVRTAVIVVALLAACSAKPRAISGDAPAIDAAAADAKPACTQNTDCATGHICTAQECVLGCDTDHDCGSGDSCCAHACIPTQADPANCGGCGVTCGSADGCCSGTCSALDTVTNCGSCGSACGSGALCESMQCETPVYPSYCVNATVDELFDGFANDVAAASLLASTFTTNCAPSTVLTTANVSDATLIDQTTGQELAPNATYVLTGGPDADIAVKYLETTAALTKVYFAEPTTGTYAWMVRTSGTPVATMAATACSAHADQFVVELVAGPSGTLSLIGYGICTGAGTFGAAYFYADVMLANTAMYPDTWYVVGWADTNNDGIANAGATFTVLAHGS
jgi:hypothetical protein